MANAHRGEISAELGGETRTLCLTLGALAELESAFGVGGLAGLAARFEQGDLSARDLLAIIGCGLRGGGTEIADADVARLTAPEGLNGYVRIAAALLAATFGAMAPGKDAVPNPPAPQDA